MNKKLELDFSDQIKARNLDQLGFEKIEDVYLKTAHSDFKYLNINLMPFLKQHPPRNSSLETYKELLEVKKFIESKHSDEFKSNLKKMDDDPAKFIIDYFQEKSNKEIPSRALKVILDGDVEILAMKLKVFYNRPRPYQIAEHLNINLNHNKSIQNKTAKTPSYPSGHTLSAYFTAKVLSLIDPSLKLSLLERAKMVADSRVFEGVHFKSDNDFSIYLSENALMPAFLNLK